MHVETLFPSAKQDGKARGGVVLVEVEQTDPGGELSLVASWTERDGSTHTERVDVVVAGRVVEVQRPVLIGPHREPRDGPERLQSDPGQRHREGDDAHGTVAGRVHLLGHLPERQDCRATEFVGFADVFVVGERVGQHRNEVADPDRLESGLLPAAGQGIQRDAGREHPLEFLREGDELAALAEHHGGADDHPVERGVADDLLGPALRADVVGRAVRVGPQRAHLDEPLDAVFLGGLDAVFGAAPVNPVVGLVAAAWLEQRRQRDEVDRGVLALEGPFDALVVGHVTLDSLDAGGQVRVIG